MAEELRILILEDSPEDFELIVHELHLSIPPFITRHVDRQESFLEALQIFKPDLILGDYSLPGYDGLTALTSVRERCPEIPFIFVSGTIGEEAAIETLKAGATDYVLKSRLMRLGPAVIRALDEAEQRCRRRQAERERENLSTAVEQSEDWILLADPQGIIQYANRAVERISGYSREEMIGKTPRIFKSGHHDSAYFDKLWQTVLADKPFRDIMINRRKTGEIYYLDETISALTDDHGEIINLVATGKDVTRQRWMEERLNYLAYYDVLTGLPNRSLYTDRLNQAIVRLRHSTKLIATLVIDIDRFKYINDSLGSAAGDGVLKEIGRRLGRTVRDGDTVARLGGDEFGIIFNDVDELNDTIVVVEKLIRKVSGTIEIAGEEIVVSFSSGIAVFPHDGIDAEALMLSAEVALIEAKKQKGNSYQFFAKGMNVSASNFIKLERDLTRALREGEFRMLYQPYFDSRSGRMAGIESLLRWQGPVLGLRNPDEFIPVLEESGLILEVGNWIFSRVCSQLQDWLRAGWELVPVAVNLSPLQFQDRRLVTFIESTLKEFAIDPRLLTLEITEGSLIQDTEYTRSLLKDFQQMGLQLELDDFGTGYSSLSYVARYPFQQLKVDISFVRDIASDKTSAAIVSAIISMARDLGLKTIAEGVENATQLDILKKLGCDMIQGFHFSKPLTALEMEQVFQQNKLTLTS